MSGAALRTLAAEGRAADTATTAIRRLTLTAFRNYERTRIEAAPRPIVLYGPNGAGKTNMLEAISFLAPGRGLRRARLVEIDRRGADATWAVAADVTTPRGEIAVGTGRERGEDDARDRRAVRVDGRPASQGRLAEVLQVLWVTPEMDRLFADGGSARRRFLDRMVYGFDAAHAGRINAYEHALRERARLLRENRGDAHWLGALEGTMAEQAVAITAARQEVVGRLDRAARAPAGPFPAATVAIEGLVEEWLGEMPALAAEERLRARYRETRRRDAESGGAAAGPHRSDLAVRHVARDMPAALCSTGEQKALLLALVLANARALRGVRDTAPVLLFDEVAAHLDEERRAALFDEICALEAQAWLTGTDGAVFAAFDGRAEMYRVESARVTRVDG